MKIHRLVLFILFFLPPLLIWGQDSTYFDDLYVASERNDADQLTVVQGDSAVRMTTEKFLEDVNSAVGDNAAAIATYASHAGNTNNPHQVDPTDILPDQTGNGGKVLGTDGSDLSWVVGGGASTDSSWAEITVPFINLTEDGKTYLRSWGPYSARIGVYEQTKMEWRLNDIIFSTDMRPSVDGAWSLGSEDLHVDTTWTDHLVVVDSTAGNTVFHLLASPKVYVGRLGAGNAGDVATMLEGAVVMEAPVVGATIVFDSIQTYCRGTSGNISVRGYVLDTYDDGSPTAIHAALNPVTGTEATTTSFSVASATRGQILQVVVTAVTTAPEELYYYLFYHETN